jgi:transposase-like protein
VEEILNSMLDAEADALCGAQRYERSPDRVDTRAGSYEHQFHTKAGSVTLKMPKLRKQTFETMIIERYRRREASIEETLTYYRYPDTHWRRFRTNNPLERVMREIRRWNRFVGAFLDGQSVLMLCAARPRHIAGTKWGAKRYRSMEALRKQDLENQLTA